MKLLMRVACVLFSCVAVPIFADSEIVGTVSGGQKCQPVNERQSEYFERREDGIWNVSTDQAFWLICPIDLPYALIKTVCPSLAVSNRSEVTAEVNCVFREFGWDGSEVQAIANGPALIESGATHFVNAYWWDCRIPTARPGSTWNIACLMPPKTGVRRVYNLYFESEE